MALKAVLLANRGRLAEERMTGSVGLQQVGLSTLIERAGATRAAAERLNRRAANEYEGSGVLFFPSLRRTTLFLLPPPTHQAAAREGFPPTTTHGNRHTHMAHALTVNPAGPAPPIPRHFHPLRFAPLKK